MAKNGKASFFHCHCCASTQSLSSASRLLRVEAPLARRFSSSLLSVQVWILNFFKISFGGMHIHSSVSSCHCFFTRMQSLNASSRNLPCATPLRRSFASGGAVSAPVNGIIDFKLADIGEGLFTLSFCSIGFD
jgi:hypothetical protein